MASSAIFEIIEETVMLDILYASLLGHNVSSSPPFLDSYFGVELWHVVSLINPHIPKKNFPRRCLNVFHEYTTNSTSSDYEIKLATNPML